MSAGVISVGDFGRRETEHAFGADIENLNDALGIGGDTREIRAVEYRALQGWGDVEPFLRRRVQDPGRATDIFLTDTHMSVLLSRKR